MRKEYDFSGATRGPAVAQPGKTRITIMLDADIVAAFRARASDTGRGYQTAINRALREYLANDELETTLRRVVREELRYPSSRSVSVESIREAGAMPGYVVERETSEGGSAVSLRTRPDGFTAYGVDGCSAGWFVVVVRPVGRLEFRVVPRIDHLVNQVETTDRIHVDIPIGLPDGPDERECDKAARRLLGEPRRRSVFRAPAREVLPATSFEQAGQISRRATSVAGGRGVGVTQQTYAILPKIKEVDDLIRRRDRARAVIREVHPEVCFAGFGRGPMKNPKKQTAGFEERREVLRAIWPDIDSLIEDALAKTLRKNVARDDVMDAAIAAFTACQDEKLLKRLPANQREDCYGLPMEMVYAEAP